MQVSEIVSKRVFHEPAVYYASRRCCETAPSRSIWSKVSVWPIWWQTVGGPRDKILDSVSLVWPVRSRVITTSSAPGDAEIWRVASHLYSGHLPVGLSWSRGSLASWSTPDIITSLIISYFSCCCGLNIPHLIRYRGDLLALASSPNECSWCGKFTDDMSPWRKTCNNFVLEIRMFHAQPSGNFNKHYTSRWGMNFHPRLWDIWKLFKGLYQVCELR